jgi:hypothetical protein
MSRSIELELEIQRLVFSIDPITQRPYPQDLMQVADGGGTRQWNTVFQTISSQAAYDGGSFLIDYLPSTLQTMSNNASSLSTIIATSYSTLSTQIGQGGIPGSITSAQLQSTVSWVQNTATYVSSGQLISSMTPLFDGTLSFGSNIRSTVVGLGSSGYISTQAFLSTAVANNTLLRSTTAGLATYGYISSLSLQSTVQNLGQANYISSSALTSTVTGLLYPATSPGGSLGVVLAGSSDSPYNNYNTLTSNYLASNAFFNFSNAGTYGVVYANSLPSTTYGLISSLGTYGYVSTQTMLSTSAGIQAAKQNIFIDRLGGASIFGSQVYISSVAAITFLSSFVNSTITYRGQNGPVGAVVTDTYNMTFSTANLQLDRFSSLITANSRITGELYPTFQFDRLTTGALTSRAFPMSTFLQYGTTMTSATPLLETLVVGTSAQNGFSNVFQQPMKFSIPGSSVINTYVHPYVLSHTLVGSYSQGLNVGFNTSNVNVFIGSTNTYFLSVQNLTF